jgi:hypothetical protein
MPTLIQEDVCTFDELSDDVKETARDWMRNCEIEDFGQDTESLYYSALAAAKILGIDFDDKGKRSEPDIRWSGFSSQGDGASFVGSYSHSPNSPARIRSEFPTDTALHAIADGLDAIQNGYRLLTGHRINARITQDDNHYVHAQTMSVTVEDAETGDELEDVEPEEKILDLMRDFAEWIYRGLEAEYDYRLSDENIDERIGCGEYQFDAETGEVV